MNKGFMPYLAYLKRGNDGGVPLCWEVMSDQEQDLGKQKWIWSMLLMMMTLLSFLLCPYKRWCLSKQARVEDRDESHTAKSKEDPVFESCHNEETQS